MFKSVNPATGKEIATHPELTPDEIEQRLAKAAEAFEIWRNTGLDERVKLLGSLADLYDQNRDRLARTITEEMGKTLATARAEIEKCASAFRHYAKEGPAMLEPRRYALSGGGEAEARYLPQGPVLAIMPWNFPFWQAVRFLAPTILAGNVGLLKHASNVQGCAQLLEEMVTEAGGPEGLFQNLAVKSDKINAIIADKRVTAVTLTGSEGAGAAVAKSAGEQIKKVVLELGGSDPFIVMPSADMDKAVPQAVKARVQNTGQSCICGKRLILHADIHDEFLDRFVAEMRKVKTGDPMDDATDIGPLSSMEQRDTVLDQIEMAKKAGAKLLFGGEKLEGDGAFMSPGVLVDIPRDGPLQHEEIFGPIMMVFKATDIDDAIRIANNVPFGLGSSVWTQDSGEQDRFVRDIAAGMTAINQMLASAPEAPFGGVKLSGFGRELAAFGLHEFMNVKTVMLPPAA